MSAFDDDYESDVWDYFDLWNKHSGNNPATAPQMPPPPRSKPAKPKPPVEVPRDAMIDDVYINSLSGPTKIAVQALVELVKQGKADFLLLRDDAVKDFWSKHLAVSYSAQLKRLEEERVARVRREALNKLTSEEKRLLGIKE